MQKERTKHRNDSDRETSRSEQDADALALDEERPLFEIAPAVTGQYPTTATCFNTCAPTADC